MKRVRSINSQKDGFSLAEILIVIAILAILGGVVAVSASTIIKNTRQKTLDRMAETIFLVAERNIQSAALAGNGDKLGSDGENQVDSSAPDSESAQLILPADTVSADILAGKWLIRYTVGNGSYHIKEVYCTTADNSYAAEFAYDVGALSSVHSSKAGKVGYYGGGGIDSFPASINHKKINAFVSLENDEELGVKLYIKLPDNTGNGADFYSGGSPKEVEYTVNIIGAVTQNEIQLVGKLNSSSTYEYAGTTGSNAYIGGGQFRYYITLDNIKDQQFKDLVSPSSTNAKRDGATIVADSNNKLAPGEDIIVSVVAKCAGEASEQSGEATVEFPPSTDTEWGKSAQANSLFEERIYGEKDEIHVAYGRHLQNLDSAISGMPEDRMLDVVLTKTIDFNNTGSADYNKSWVKVYGTNWTYSPVSNVKIDTFDGGAVLGADGSVGADGLSIKNLKINFTDNRAKTTNATTEKRRQTSAGIFGIFSGSKISNVVCSKFSINYTRSTGSTVESQQEFQSTAVGCLFGISKNKIEVRNCRCDEAEILVGQTSTSSYDKAMIAGLAGHALAGIDMQNCYTDKSIIIGPECCCYSGGLIAFTCSLNFSPGVQQMDNTELIVKDCKTTKSVIGGSRSGGIISGGIVSYAFNKTIYIENCIAEGVQLSASANTVAIAGGIIGQPICTNGTIKDCKVYNTDANLADFADSGIGKNGAYTRSHLSVARKYVQGTSTGGNRIYDARNMGWFFVSGGGTSNQDGTVQIASAGGLAGLNNSTDSLVVENSFAATTIYSNNNNGINAGLVANGRSTAKTVINNSYADCYMNGQFISGLASNCAPSSTYTNSYSAGFLMCDGAKMAAGITTSKATVTGCYSLMNYDNIWDTSKFSTTSLTFDQGYVASYPGEAVPANDSTVKIYLIAGDNSTVDENTFYTYGGDGDFIKDQSSQTSNKAEYISLKELVEDKGLGEMGDKTPSRLAPDYISNNLATAKLPAMLGAALPHVGDWLERPGNQLWARIYKTSDNKYVMYFEKGSKKTKIPNTNTTLTLCGEWLADDNKKIAEGATPSEDSGFLHQADVMPTDEDQSDATKLAKVKLIAPWQYANPTGAKYGWKSGYTSGFETILKSITTVTFDEDFYKDKKTDKPKAQPLSMRQWFKGFEATTVFNNIEKLDVSEVTNMAELFRNCYEVLRYDLSTWNTAKVTSMQYMFGMGKTDIPIPTTANDTENAINRLAKTTEIIFGETFVTHNVTDMGAMFKRQGNLTTIDLSTFNFANVTDMEFMFDFCKKMTSIVGFTDKNSIVDAGKVKNMNHLFYNDLAMPEYDLSGWITSKTELKITRSMFGTYRSDGNAHATKIILGENFFTDGVEDMGYMFQSQDTVKELDLSSFNTGSVTHIRQMFYDCKSLTTIYASKDFVVPRSADGSGMFDNCKVLVGGCGTKWADKSGSQQTDKTYAWIDGRYDESESIANPYTGTSEGYFTNREFSLWARIYKLNDNPDYELVFEQGEKQSNRECLAEYPGNTFLIERTDFDILGETDKDWVAYAPWHGKWTNAGMESNSLRENITKASFTDEFCALAKPVTMRNWFANMYKLEKVDFNKLDTSKVKNMMGLFSSWPESTTNQLTELDLKVFKTDSIKKTTHMFRNCKKLVTIWVSEDFSVEGAENTSMFSNCDVLVGGCGTAWADQTGTNQTHHTYAWIDGREDNPITGTDEGYFTNAEYSGLYARVYKKATDSNYYVMRFEKGGKYKNTDLIFVAEWLGDDGRGNGFLNKNMDGAIRESNNHVLNKFEQAPWQVNQSYEGWYVLDDNAHSRGESGSNDGISKIKDVTFTTEFCAKAKPKDTSYWFWCFCQVKTMKNLDSLDTKNVTDMSHMFEWNYAVVYDNDTVNIDTSNVTNMASMFRAHKGNNRTITYGEKFVTNKVTDMSYMFQRCNGLPMLDLTNWDTSNVSKMTSMFDDCYNLKTIYASDKFDVTNVTAHSDMFKSCNVLVGGCGTKWADKTGNNKVNKTYAWIDGRIGNNAAVSAGGQTAEGYFTNKKYPDVWARLYSNGDTTYTLYFEHGERDSEIVHTDTFVQEWGNVDTQFLSTGTVPWSGAPKESITKVVFSENFCSVSRPENTTSWFEGFSTVTDFVNISNLNVTNLKSAEKMFYNCSSIVTLDIYNWNASKLTSMRRMFQNDTKLTVIYAKNNLYHEGVNVDNSFTGCTDIVGGNGTKYTGHGGSGIYGIVDDWNNNKTGYLTKEWFYAVYDSTAQPVPTLTFYNGDSEYNSALNEEGKEAYRVSAGGYNRPDTIPWKDHRESIGKVIFAESVNPYSIGYWFTGFTGISDGENFGLEHFHSSNLLRMEGLFRECSELTTYSPGLYKMDNLDTSRVHDMSQLFYGCTKLSSIDVNGLDTSSVTNMDNMFGYCKGVTTLDVSYLDVGNVTNMHSMFQHCEEMTSINVEWSDVSKVNDMSGMFLWCIKLQKIDISTWDTASLTSIGQMFHRNYVLTEIIASKNLYTDKTITTTDGAFNNCYVLEGGAGTHWTSDKAGVEYAVIDDPTNGKPGYLKLCDLFANIYSDGNGGYELVVESKTGSGEIHSEALTRDADGYCDFSQSKMDGKEANITKITVKCPISIKECNGLFANMAALKSIEGLEKVDFSGATSMKSMFEGCSSLITLDISSFNVDNVTDYDDMFKNCSRLRSITCITDFREASPSTAHGVDMFAGCTNLSGGITTYDPTHTDIEYARPDGGTTSPGYFSGKTTVKPDSQYPEIMVVTITKSDSSTMMIYYYNDVFYETRDEAIAAYEAAHP